MSEDDHYLVWSNEHRAWWAPGSRGYVTAVSNAGRFTRAQALQFCTQAILGSSRGVFNDIPVREADVREFVDGVGGLIPAGLL